MTGKGKLHGSPFHIENKTYMYAIEHENEIATYVKENSTIKCEHQYGMMKICKLWCMKSYNEPCIGEKCDYYKAHIFNYNICSVKFYIYRLSCPIFHNFKSCIDCSDSQKNKCEKLSNMIIEENCQNCKSNINGICAQKFDQIRKCRNCTNFVRNECVIKPNEGTIHNYYASICNFYCSRTTKNEKSTKEAMNIVINHLINELNGYDDLKQVIQNKKEELSKSTDGVSKNRVSSQIEMLEEHQKYRKTHICKKINDLRAEADYFLICDE